MLQKELILVDILENQIKKLVIRLKCQCYFHKYQI